MRLDSADGILERHRNTCREFHRVISRCRPDQQSNHSQAMDRPVGQQATSQTAASSHLPGMI